MNHKLIYLLDHMGSCKTKKDKQTVPGFMAFNQHIRLGYRVGHSFSMLLKSLFKWHNQTVNIWTHLIPAVVTFSLLMSSSLYADMHYQQSQIKSFLSPLQQQLTKVQMYQEMNLTNTDESREQVMLNSLVQHFLTPISVIRQQTGLLMQLTAEDDLPLRGKISNRLKLIEKIGAHLDRVVLDISNNKYNSSTSLNTQLQNHQRKISQLIAEIIEEVKQLADQVSIVPKWPIMVFYLSVALTMTFSITYHLFYPFSYHTYKLLSNLDFSGIIILIVGSSCPMFVYYSHCHNIFAPLYLPALTIVGLGLFAALTLGYLRGRQNKRKRHVAFAAFGLLYAVPFGHMLIVEFFYDSYGDPLKFSEFVGYYFLLCPVYFSGLFILSVKCPERYSPGTFDICGASHQLWHLFSIAGMLLTYWTNWELYYRRRMCPCPVTP